jgi:hypothetical protein
MKKRITILLTISTVVFFTFCKKEEEKKQITNNTKSNLFLVGVADSLHYIDYNPDLRVVFFTSVNDYYSLLDSIDYNSDGNYDFFFNMNGFADNFQSGITNYYEFKLMNLKAFDFVCDSNNLLKPLQLNDTLNSTLNWKNSNEFLMIYSSPYNNAGNWFYLQNDNYIGFRKIVANDTTMGWFRICRTIPTDTSGFLIKDCGLND